MRLQDSGRKKSRVESKKVSATQVEMVRMNTLRGSRSGLIAVALLALGCVARPSDVAGVTKSRLHLLGVLGKAALEQQKPLDGVASIGDFLDVVKVEAEGRFEDDEADEWGRPFLIATSTSKTSRGIQFLSLGRDVNDGRDDLRLWLFVPDIANDEVVTWRSW